MQSKLLYFLPIGNINFTIEVFANRIVGSIIFVVVLGNVLSQKEVGVYYWLRDIP
jgi:hypothetical protein